MADKATNTYSQRNALDYSAFIQQLSTSLTTDEDLVVGLDAGWGAGKTFFLKTWEEESKDEKIINLVYVNMFEEEYLGDPLLSLVSAMANSLGIKSKGRHELMSKASILSRRTATVIAAELAKGIFKYVTKSDPNDIANEILESASEDGMKALGDHLQRFNSKKNDDALASLRKSLKEHMNNQSKGSRLIVVVDELDRCRPDYAVSALEILKHIFVLTDSEPLGISFLVSTNKKEMANSIRGYYGSDLIDGEQYLDRFFDYTVSLPLFRPYNLISQYSCSEDQGEDKVLANFLRGAHKNQVITLRNIERFSREAKTLFSRKSKLRGFDVNDKERQFIYALLFMKRYNPGFIAEISNRYFEGDLNQIIARELKGLGIVELGVLKEGSVLKMFSDVFNKQYSTERRTEDVENRRGRAMMIAKEIIPTLVVE